MRTAFFAVLFYLIQYVVAWGAGVHPVIGHLAELYLLDQTVCFSPPVLRPQLIFRKKPSSQFWQVNPNTKGPSVKQPTGPIRRGII